MSIRDINGWDGVEGIIDNIKKQNPRIDSRIFSDDLSEAKIDKESKRLSAAKQELYSSLSAISAFPNYFFDKATSVEYATDENWDIIKDPEHTTIVEHDATDLFVRSVANFYNPQSSNFPTVTLDGDKLELNVEERSFILELLDSAMQDDAVKNIVKNIDVIKDANNSIKEIHKATSQQTFLLRHLHEKLTHTDELNKTTSADFLLENIDVFKKLYADTTSEDDHRVHEAINTFDKLAKSDPNNLSSTTAVLSAFDLFYNEGLTYEMREQKIDSVRAEHAKVIHSRTADIDWDAIDAQFKNDAEAIKLGIEAEEAGMNTTDFVEERARRELVQKGKDAAERNPFASIAANLMLTTDEPEVVPQNNVINAFGNSMDKAKADVEAKITPPEHSTDNVVRVKFGR